MYCKNPSILAFCIIILILCLITSSIGIQTCEDGVKNQDESDIDCGGVCKKCRDGLYCHNDSDCISNYCYEGICKRPSCNDGIKNQNETDVDCGGLCKKCMNGMGCKKNEDCISNYCYEGICKDVKIKNVTNIKNISIWKTNKNINLIGYVGTYSGNGLVILLLFLLTIFYFYYERARYHKIIEKERKIIDLILNERQTNKKINDF